MKYVQIQSGGNIHRRREGTTKTVCGREYARFDYLPIAEDELDVRYQSLCHKCEGTRREGPRTIREAFTPGNIYEKRGQ